MEENDLGPQPLDQLIEEWGLSNHQIVEVSTEQLTHKQVQRARNGRRLTLKMMMKVTRAFNVTIWHGLNDCLLYTSPSPRDRTRSRMPSSA